MGEKFIKMDKQSEKFESLIISCEKLASQALILELQNPQLLHKQTKNNDQEIKVLEKFCDAKKDSDYEAVLPELTKFDDLNGQSAAASIKLHKPDWQTKSINRLTYKYGEFGVGVSDMSITMPPDVLAGLFASRYRDYLKGDQ